MVHRLTISCVSVIYLQKSKSPITSTLLRMSKRRFGGPPPGCRSIASSSAENIEVNKVRKIAEFVDMMIYDVP